MDFIHYSDFIVELIHTHFPNFYPYYGIALYFVVYFVHTLVMKHIDMHMHDVRFLLFPFEFPIIFLHQIIKWVVVKITYTKIIEERILPEIIKGKLYYSVIEYKPWFGPSAVLIALAPFILFMLFISFDYQSNWFTYGLALLLVFVSILDFNEYINFFNGLFSWSMLIISAGLVMTFKYDFFNFLDESALFIAMTLTNAADILWDANLITIIILPLSYATKYGYSVYLKYYPKKL